MRQLTEGSRRTTGLIPALLLLLTLALWLPTAGAESGDRAAKEAELQRLREHIGQLREELEHTRGQYDELRSQLRETERAISELTGKLSELERQLGEQDRQLRTLQEREQTLKTQVAEQTFYLAGQVRAAYITGRQEYLKILLNQEDPAEVGRVLAYYGYLTRARNRRINTIKASLQELSQVRLAIDAESLRLRNLQATRAAEMASLEARRMERRGVIASLKREIGDKDRELERMQADEQALLELITALSHALEDIPAEPGNRQSFASQRGELRWPTRGRISVDYGSPRQSGNIRWQGVVIGANDGQAVRAVSHGRVAFADWLRGYGLLIIIDHGDGYMSLYGYNQSLLKEVGDWVESGEQIATVGDSGGQERSALYFEIRHQGKPSNPSRWCGKPAA